MVHPLSIISAFLFMPEIGPTAFRCRGLEVPPAQQSRRAQPSIRAAGDVSCSRPIQLHAKDPGPFFV